MCDPLIIGATAQVLGTAIQNDKMQKAEGQKGQFLDANRDRNRRLENSAASSITNSRDAFNRSSFDPAMQSEEKRLSDIYAANAQSALPNMPSLAGVPSVIRNSIIADMEAANAYNIQQDKAKAKLGSFANLLSTKLNPQLGQSSSDTALMGNFMQGNSGVLPSELDAANRSGYSPLAQLLTGAGRTATAYGLKG